MRIKIKSPEQYYSLLDDAKKRWGRLQNNAYFLPEFLESQIRQDRLTALLLEDALLFFADRGSYELLYFQSPLGAVPQKALEGLQKPVAGSLIGVMPPEFLPVSGAPGRLPEEAVPAKLRPGCRFLAGLGLGRADCYYHMSAAAICPPINCEPPGFRFSPAHKGQLPEILALLDASFPPLTSDLPDMEGLEGLVEKQEAFTLTDPSGRLCGYCQFEAQGNKHMLRHLVIVPAYRGQHLAAYALQCLAAMYPGGPSFLWVGEDNATASGLYQKFGYRFDGRILINFCSVISG